MSRVGNGDGLHAPAVTAVEVRGDGADVNAVRLRGRVSSEPERRVLPSGDEVVVLRLVVRRPDGDAVDTIDVSVGPGPAPGGRAQQGQVGRRVLSSAERVAVDDRVEVVGQLRRRWWDAGVGRRSRVEVRATAIARVVADDPPAAGPVRARAGRRRDGDRPVIRATRMMDAVDTTG